MIPVNIPRFSGNEKAYLAECIDTGWISSEGPFVRRFENEMAELCGRRHGIAVSNGTAALEAGFVALGLQPGDEVILPAFTIISCAAAIVRAGGIPVPCDVDPLTWNMTTADVATVITPRSKAILVVHTYGLSCPMAELTALAQQHGLILIEDAAEAHGQRSDGRSCGSFGLWSAFSFYANKHVAAGEGGMVLTDDDRVAERCRNLRNLCFGKTNRFKHEELAWNYRLGNLQAAVAVAQLEQLSETIRIKQRIGQRYSVAFADLASVQRPLDQTPWCDNHYWVYGLVLTGAYPGNAQQAMSELGKLGIASRPFFLPMDQQPALTPYLPAQAKPCLESARLAERGFYIPSGPGLDESMQDQVITAVRGVLGHG